MLLKSKRKKGASGWRIIQCVQYIAISACISSVDGCSSSRGVRGIANLRRIAIYHAASCATRLVRRKTDPLAENDLTLNARSIYYIQIEHDKPPCLLVLQKRLLLRRPLAKPWTISWVLHQQLVVAKVGVLTATLECLLIYL